MSLSVAEKMKLKMDSSPAGKEMSSQKISVVAPDQMNGVYCSGEKQSSSFVVDIESFETRAETKELRTPISKIIKSFSRKGSIPGSEKLTYLNQIATESPRGSPCSPKTPLALVAVENHVGSDHHHHVTITTRDPETKLHARRQNSFRRPQSMLAIDPRKVLFVFATLSSLGSLLLIYFTLAIKG